MSYRAKVVSAIPIFIYQLWAADKSVFHDP
jgi:hypothetical protein